MVLPHSPKFFLQIFRAQAWNEFFDIILVYRVPSLNLSWGLSTKKVLGTTLLGNPPRTMGVTTLFVTFCFYAVTAHSSGCESEKSRAVIVGI